MKISSIPKSGRKGSVVYLKTRHGNVARQYVLPRNPRTAEQQGHRDNVRAVTGRWRKLSAEQRAAWCTAAANKYSLTETGRRVSFNGYHHFVSLNVRRADLGLPQFDLPPAEPVFSPNPVAELVIDNTRGRITLRLRVPSPSAQYTLVQGPAPVRTGVRCVQHFPFLGLLPAPTDGWSDITELYVARYGVPKFGTAIWIRTCQHIDGWIDVPKVVRARVPPQRHSDAHCRRLTSAAAAAGVRSPVERVPTWRNWCWVSPAPCRSAGFPCLCNPLAASLVPKEPKPLAPQLSAV
jgi:hypothetical protein